MKRRNLKAYSPVSNNSAGTLIIVLWQIFQQAILFSSKKYKKKTWHFNFTYEQFPFSMHIQDGTLIQHLRLKKVVELHNENVAFSIMNKFLNTQYACKQVSERLGFF